MADSQKLVLMVQMTRLQGLIWQTVLKSQQLSVIWETPEIDLFDSLTQLEQAGLALPDLLLIDVRIENFNPYAFCRWCRENHPTTNIVLTNPSQKEILPSERQWAIHQGASDFLPGFQLENLVSSVAFSVKRVLDILDSHPLNNGALISVLLSMKRQLDARSADRSQLQPAPRREPEKKAISLDTPPETRLEVKPQLPSGYGKGNYSLGEPARVRSTSKPKFLEAGSPVEPESLPVRRYRGLIY